MLDTVVFVPVVGVAEVVRELPPQISEELPRLRTLRRVARGTTVDVLGDAFPGRRRQAEEIAERPMVVHGSDEATQLARLVLQQPGEDARRRLNGREE